ncbi:viscotoxin-A3 [Slackia heliotrinireducens]|uniref:viscotoxin-A3 n=1 Tax=Slackia heliotrinireducens TaxID=84110 RepID=UPI0033156B92
MSKKNKPQGFEISDEMDREERELLKDVPRVNIAAFFAPPIWGPANGLWVSILFYPLWVMADTAFVNAYVMRTPLAVTIGVAVFFLMVAITYGFATISQPFALHRALSLGVSKETYLKRQRIWAVVAVIIGIAALAVATYYNLALNPKIVG